MATPPPPPLDYEFTPREYDTVESLLLLKIKPVIIKKPQRLCFGLAPTWSIRRKRTALLQSPPPPLDNATVVELPKVTFKLSSLTTPDHLAVKSLPLSTRSTESDEGTSVKRSKKKPSIDKMSLGFKDEGSSSSAMKVESSNEEHLCEFENPVGVIDPLILHELSYGPMEIPDLNMSHEEIRHRFMAAQENRCKICNKKLQIPPTPST